VNPPQNPTINPIVRAGDGILPAAPSVKTVPAIAHPTALITNVLTGNSVV